MEPKPKASAQTQSEPIEFAEPPARTPLVLLQATERSLRLKTVEILAPILPEKTATSLTEVSQVAEESLQKLAEIDLDEITDEDLKPARIQVGLAFVGFGALMMVFLLLYLYTLHPEINAADQVKEYWYQYIWFVGLGVAGMFMLGREAMRPRRLTDQETLDDWE
ncbi:MAG: hypothetical protein KME16_17805 [Scytolyngbya sp. HA4215-MV1]|jgi:hypothetical protein|nr:hypothetical protein [Scytolyngbya sp. HA4215-MV1]